jgi:hypothetical protein
MPEPKFSVILLETRQLEMDCLGPVKIKIDYGWGMKATRDGLAGTWTAIAINWLGSRKLDGLSRN